MKLRKKKTETDSRSDDAELETAGEEDSSRDLENPKLETSASRRSAGIMFYAKIAGFGVLMAVVGGLSAYVILQFQDTGHPEIQQELVQQNQDIVNLRDRISGIETAQASIGDRLAEVGGLQAKVDRIGQDSTEQSGTVLRHGQVLEDREGEVADLKAELADVSRELSALVESSRQRFVELETRPPSVISVDAPEGEQDILISRLSAFESRVGALASRVTALETSQAGMPSAEEVSARVASLEESFDGLTTPDELKATVVDNARRIVGLESGFGGNSAITPVGLGIVAVRAAVEIGAPYSRIISDAGLSGDDLPAVVFEHAGTGIATASYLRDSFEGYAREALMASPGLDSAAGENGGVLGFLGSLFQVRPLSPREGESSGAVLSRAEAALQEDNIEASLQILGSLPEANRSTMAAWIQAAETRIAVLSALDSLAGSRNVE